MGVELLRGPALRPTGLAEELLGRGLGGAVLLCAAVEVVLLLGAALEGAGGAVPGGVVGDVAGVRRVVGGVVQERRDAWEELAAGLAAEGGAAEWDVPGHGGEGERAEVREGGQVVGGEEVLHGMGSVFVHGRGSVL